MNRDDYLVRIGLARAGETVAPPSAAALSELQRAHLRAVPFENLDIALGRRFGLDLAEVYEKVVVRRRGGFCYELNGLFAWLLDSLGYEVTRLAARVHDGTGWGPERDHLLLRVDVDGAWLVDVGFGDSFLTPLRLVVGDTSELHTTYRLSETDGHWMLSRRRDDGWEPQLRFSLTPEALGNFVDMCTYQQTAPDSTFTRKTVCSRATRDGRITMTHDRVIVRRGNERTERPLADAADARRTLVEAFGIDLKHDDLDRLLRRRGRGEVS